MQWFIEAPPFSTSKTLFTNLRTSFTLNFPGSVIIYDVLSTRARVSGVRLFLTALVVYLTSSFQPEFSCSPGGGPLKRDIPDIEERSLIGIFNVLNQHGMDTKIQNAIDSGRDAKKIGAVVGVDDISDSSVKSLRQRT